MPLRLDDVSIDLLQRFPQNLFLGILEVGSGHISLFLADRTCVPSRRRFRGHEDLLRRNIVSNQGVLGFSFQLKRGKIARFYRNSVLNKGMPFFCLSLEDVDKIMETCGLQTSEDFVSYP